MFFAGSQPTWADKLGSRLVLHASAARRARARARLARHADSSFARWSATSAARCGARAKPGRRRAAEGAGAARRCAGADAGDADAAAHAAMAASMTPAAAAMRRPPRAATAAMQPGTPRQRREPACRACTLTTRKHRSLAETHAHGRAHDRRTGAAARCAAQSAERRSSRRRSPPSWRAWRNPASPSRPPSSPPCWPSEPAKWRTQLTRLAPLLGIELFKETQAQIARIAELRAGLAPAAADGSAHVARQHGPGGSQAAARHRACLRADGGHGRHVALLR